MFNLIPSRVESEQPATLAVRPSERVSVAAVSHPFRRERVVTDLPAGGSVADMLRAVGIDSAIPARIFLDDYLVPLDQRTRTYPRPGQILTVRVIPAGGGRGKDVEILTIVVAAIATVASYGAASFVTAALTAPGVAAASGPTLAGAAGALVGGAVASSLNFLGGLAINSLIPPPRTPVPKQETTPQSYTVSGTANAAAPFSPIPKIYGQRRIFPQYAASPYNELVGFDQYLRMLFLPGYGPLDISQIKIGDTAIEAAELELKTLHETEQTLTICPTLINEQQPRKCEYLESDCVFCLIHSAIVRSRTRLWRILHINACCSYPAGTSNREFARGRSLEAPFTADSEVVRPRVLAHGRKRSRPPAPEILPKRRVLARRISVAHPLRVDRVVHSLFLLGGDRLLRDRSTSCKRGDDRNDNQRGRVNFHA